MKDNFYLPTKEEYDQALRNYGKFLAGMYVLYIIYMVVLLKGHDIATWIADKWNAFKGLFRRGKKHYDLSEFDLES